MARSIPTRAGEGTIHRLRWFLGVIVAAITLATFAPATRYGFVGWDDEAYFTDNPHLGGPDRGHFGWCFKTFYMGHYQPLNWASYEIDYLLYGGRPERLHLTQILLHVLITLLVVRLAARILVYIHPQDDLRAIELAAAAAGILFGVHPLHVESVVWLSARSDVIAALFFVPSLIAYLRYAADPRGRAWLFVAWTLYLFSVLGKEMAVTLPALLVLLDVYPLRRLPASFRAALAEKYRPVWFEKLPFFAVAATVSITAFFAAGKSLAPLQRVSIGSRLPQAAVSLMFYPFKLLAPFRLSPLYELPSGFGPFHPWVVVSVGCLVAIGLLCIVLRRRMPGLIAATAAYAILILPVSGLVQRGPQMAADRYTYLGALPFLLLAAWLVARFFAAMPRPTTVGIIALVAACVTLTRDQIAIWKDSVSLWEHAISLDRTNASAHANVAYAYDKAGRYEDAVREYRLALAIRRTQPRVHAGLAALFNRLYRNEEAIAEYQADLRDNPNNLQSHFFLGVTYERISDANGAEQEYREVIQLDQADSPARLNLGRLLFNQGRLIEAEPHLARVLERDSQNTPAMAMLADIWARTGRLPDAINLVDRALAAARAHGDMTAIGDLQSQREAYVSLPPASRPAAPSSTMPASSRTR